MFSLHKRFDDMRIVVLSFVCWNIDGKNQGSGAINYRNEALLGIAGAPGFSVAVLRSIAKRTRCAARLVSRGLFWGCESVNRLWEADPSARGREPGMAIGYNFTRIFSGRSVTMTMFLCYCCHIAGWVRCEWVNIFITLLKILLMVL